MISFHVNGQPGKLFTVVRAFVTPGVCCEWQGRKGEKGSTTRTSLIMTENNGLPTGFIEGPPGQPGQPGIPGKKVGNVLNIRHFISFKLYSSMRTCKCMIYPGPIFFC